MIKAAAVLMRESGGDVPLELISERAGVTRGTMYRNFADRYQLYEAVLDHEIEGIRDNIVKGNACGLFELMRHLIGLMDIYERFHYALPNIEGFAHAHCRLESLHKLILEPLANARAAGLVRHDLVPNDVLLACRMVAVGWRLDMTSDRKAALEQRLRLISVGLGVSAERAERATPDMTSYDRISPTP
nr:TetR/AcrR family transcriptional regulator [Pectobacterium brasiliense]